ncbi:ABC transporter permease [Pelagovum pacificum]|uniref:ABC transporter permease n=1 Tax=Pelagovum pacificum TaxID=2588711 RepID=A0A5C5GBV1_9RHOB|nr:ABC transporter permease [Pelagovum pacificum]QQA44627.1 ABC transporter permease [Pelagovum pacificum]TNY32262.1 ABC transporter permease [Pelagovum pacificum]
MRFSWLGLYAVLYLVFLYAPVVLLPIFAFNDGTIIAFPLQGFTTEWFGELGRTAALHDAVQASLLIAVTSAILATCLGMCAARASTMSRFPGKQGAIGFVMIPLVLPEIIVAVSLLIVVRQVLGLSLSNWTIILAHTLICVPFCIAVLNGAFQNLDPSMEEAAMDLGESRWGAFRKITLPLVAPGIVSSLLISFTISLDEFIIAFFLSGNTPTMPVYIWGLLRFPEKLPVVMALGTILVALSVILLTIAEYFRRRGLARAGLKDTGGFLG